MVKKTKDLNMFDVKKYKCWIFPCREHDDANKEHNRIQQDKRNETLMARKQQQQTEI